MIFSKREESLLSCGCTQAEYKSPKSKLIVYLQNVNPKCMLDENKQGKKIGIYFYIGIKELPNLIEVVKQDTYFSIKLTALKLKVLKQRKISKT